MKTLSVVGVLIIQILNKCIVSILVYKLFYRPTAQCFHTQQIIPYTGLVAIFMKYTFKFSRNTAI